MTRDEAREHLLAGKVLHHDAWTWGEVSRSCHDESNCCYEYFADPFYEDGRPVVERVLDDIEAYARWDEVELID